MPGTKGFLATLMARRPELETLEPVWQLIDDVLNSNVKQRSADGWRSSYFPKGRLEPQSEYAMRVELTPFFPKTPQILASRLGALFKSRLQIVASNTPSTEAAPVADERVARFIKEAGRRHTSFEDFATQATCLSQSHGFCAALLDRDPLPLDARDRTPSIAEATARNLGRPYLALYSAPDILDWDYGTDGRLAWVKFGEREIRRASWDTDGVEELVYRVVDRSAIRVFRVRRGADGEWHSTEDAPLPHGFDGRVPVVFLHPFPGADGIGRPLLRRAAESDVAAARILSDLVWDLFVLGNPILTLKTGRRDDELARLGLGATRYIPLRNGIPGQENAEELSFVQLDPTGIELLFRAHALFASQGLPSSQDAGPDIAAGAAIPSEQSGIAQAWRFKTGEERILFMLARALEPFLNECLELAGIALGIEEAPPIAKLPENFEVN
ncbi:MAG: hypothetical protein WCT04_20040 [Planctomycetota bacterium]